jgi:bacterioferritin
MKESIVRGSPQVIETLKKLLTSELTSMDVYFVQSRILKDWGLDKIAARFDHEHDDEKGHADKLIERILFLEGMPDMRTREEVDLGDSVQAMVKLNLEHELMIAKNLKDAIKLCEKEQDYETRSILVELLRDTETDHINWLETQQSLISQLGLELYSQSQISN